MKKILCALLLLPCLVHAETTLKISTQYPDGTMLVNHLKAASEEISAQTEGRVRLKVYPGGVMGDDRAVQRKISIGQLHGSFAQAGAFAQQYRDSQVLNLPLAFNSYDEVDFVRATLDPIIQEGFAENGLITFGAVDGGFAYVMSAKPVASVEQLREQKLWLPANDTGSAKAAKVFKLSPIMLNLGTVLTSLQTGAINAFAAPPAAALALQWHSRVENLTDMPLLYTYGILAINQKHFAKLSKADQKVVQTVLEDSVKQMDAESRADNIKAFAAVQKQGIQLVKPSAEQLAQWQKYGGEATAELVEEGEVSQAMLDRMQGLLTEYRAAHP